MYVIKKKCIVNNLVIPLQLYFILFLYLFSLLKVVSLKNCFLSLYFINFNIFVKKGY